MSRWRARSASWRLGFPRLRGDEPKVILEGVVGSLFSPPTRG